MESIREPGPGSDDADLTAVAAATNEARCQIVRTLDIVGEKWSLLIVREALKGRTRYSEFKEILGAPSDILSTRLAKLVAEGVLEKHGYREAGSRERSCYELTQKGRGLALVLAAMVQWGDQHNPYAGGRASVLVADSDDEPVSLAFVDREGRVRGADDVALVPGPAATGDWGRTRPPTRQSVPSLQPSGGTE
jgi:DNA-binding HxlR family transcriptional regulator